MADPARFRPSCTRFRLTVGLWLLLRGFGGGMLIALALLTLLVAAILALQPWWAGVPTDVADSLVFFVAVAWAPLVWFVRAVTGYPRQGPRAVAGSGFYR